jgi:hypothetical protein
MKTTAIVILFLLIGALTAAVQKQSNPREIEYARFSSYVNDFDKRKVVYGGGRRRGPRDLLHVARDCKNSDPASEIRL